MKIFHLATALFLSTATLAQRVNIGYPLDGANVAPGSSIVVEVDRPNTLSASTEVSIVIAVASCANSGCRSASEQMGTILYNGGYNPQYHPEAGYQKPPHQNFTVTIPNGTASGQAQLNVFHVALIGAGQTPFNETKNITINIG